MKSNRLAQSCPDCSGCKKCKAGPRIESLSIQDEIEQNLVEKCVFVDLEFERTIAKLPFLVDPEKHLVPNEHVALRVYQGQLQKLSKKPEDKLSSTEYIRANGEVQSGPDMPSHRRSHCMVSLPSSKVIKAI